MDARTKDTLAWGAVGALSFLVLAQGYVLATGESVAYPALLAVAAAVFAASAAAAHALHERLP